MLIKQRNNPVNVSALTNLPPLLQRIYATRGINEEAQLDLRLQTLLPYTLLTDIDKACLRLERALVMHEKILIIGDFDADGATATAVAVSALRSMGADQVDYLVPNRFEFGYGLTPGIVNLAKGLEPGLIITVDNGIASIEGVEVAAEAGIDVLVTDHHLPGDTLPKACAIVNPNQKGCQFVSKSIAGVGVIFYVMVALRRHLVNTGWFVKQNIPVPNMGELLDLVALGTVADVVALDQNNRILINQGLLRIRAGKARAGIRALIEVSGRSERSLRESDLGFALGPRLNAAGRLDDMSLGIECLLCKDTTQAKLLATRLDELNQERRLIEGEMKEQAFKTIDGLIKKMSSSSELPLALCLMDASWHQGVIGILAGRLKEKFHRPVIAFAVVNDEIKGSARSIPSLNIRDILALVDTENPGLITKFGGHAMAAGLTVPKENFTLFKAAFVKQVSRVITPADCEAEMLTDGELQAEDITLNTADLLHQAGPWGQHFPEPCFDNVFEILEQRLVGQHHLKLTLQLPTGSEPINAIAFNVDLAVWPNHRATHVHVAYKLDINTYNGRSSIQLMVQALKACEERMC